jgi:hypothetical protein
VSRVWAIVMCVSSVGLGGTSALLSGPLVPPEGVCLPS